MASLPGSQLSALSSGIEDLAARVAQVARDLEGDHEAEAAAILYEVERSLLMANRSMERARRILDA